MRRSTPVRAVLFDIGGVILDAPLMGIRKYMADAGINRKTFARRFTTSEAWRRLNCGTVDLHEFCKEFDSECVAAGEPGNHNVKYMVQLMNDTMVLRPRMVAAAARLQGAGFTVGGLTNNWRVGEGDQDQMTTCVEEMRHIFDVLIESCKEGVMKPDRQIYQIALDTLVGAGKLSNLEPAEVLFLDDLKHNVEAAAAFGFNTIHVDTVDQALSQLEEVVGVPMPVKK
eukprot:TRINITY_DN105539_c0_g1_i1.p1 TRINITY_DN105539_c0_g1~~TRINITY_DN105539_c0_g1_i1.p1  ORF type:complete len:227 (+),score=20.15 TRINITY_DN105539_c0_g1_i1:27-707(+)